MTFMKICKKKLKMDFIFVLLVMGLIILFALASGCGVIALDRAINNGQQLSAEQIKAYRDANVDVYGCFQIAGPPPAGATIWLMVPKGAPVTFKFGDNCHIIQ